MSVTLAWFFSLRFAGYRFESKHRLRLKFPCSCEASIYGKTTRCPITINGIGREENWHAEQSENPLWHRHLCKSQRRFEEQLERERQEQWNAERPRVTREEARQWLEELAEATEEMLKGEREREREQRQRGRR